MGTIYKKKLSDGKTRYYPLIQYNGRRHSLGGHRVKTDAEKALRRAESEIDQGTFGQAPPEDPTLDEFWARFLEQKLNIKRSTRESMVSTYKNRIGPALGSLRLSEIKPEMIQVWVNDLAGMKMKPASVAKHYRYLRSCLNKAEAWEVIPRSPCRSISMPRVEREEIKPLTIAEFGRVRAAGSAILEGMTTDLRGEKESRERARRLEQHIDLQRKVNVLVTVLGYSGMRLGEALGLAWRHVDLEQHAFIVERSFGRNGMTTPKTESSRRAVPMTLSLAAVLKDYHEEQGRPGPDALLFPASIAQPLDQSNVRTAFEEMLKKAGVRHVNMHSLRHFYASLMLSEGCSIRSLQNALGHASATMTLNTYSHLIPDAPGDALGRFDALLSGTAPGAGGKIIPFQGVNCASTDEAKTADQRG